MDPNVVDVTQVDALLYGKEKAVFADAGHSGADQRSLAKQGRRWWVATKRSLPARSALGGTITAIDYEQLRALMEGLEHARASIRTAVEHPLQVVERQLALSRPAIADWPKNGTPARTLFVLANPWIVRKHFSGRYRKDAPKWRLAAAQYNTCG